MLPYILDFEEEQGFEKPSKVADLDVVAHKIKINDLISIERLHIPDYQRPTTHHYDIADSQSTES